MSDQRSDECVLEKRQYGYWNEKQVKWKRSVGLQFPFSKASISWHKSLAWDVISLGRSRENFLTLIFSENFSTER